LVESFKATLDELKTADLLLHVVDSHDVDYKLKIKEVNNILNDIGVMNIPQIIVNNKCDLLDSSKIKQLKKKFLWLLCFLKQKLS
jgi:GTP-binding protein HflX